MSSHRQILYHIVFGTKNRRPTIAHDNKKELYKYIWGILKNKNCMLYQINGVEDHIHILTDLHPSIALADLVKDIKVASSLWMKQDGRFPDFTGWAEGYGAFTIDYQRKAILTNYIKNQERHHMKSTFSNEYLGLLKENGVDYKEKYI